MLIEDLQVILKVAEFRNITAAAENLNMRTATASAAVKRVENALGMELFIRTTRSLRLSSAGERYIPQCEQALIILDQARLKIKDELDVVDGELRISLSSDLGRNLVLPWLDEFLDTHPNVWLKTSISDSQVDFYRDAVDIALRYGSPDDTHLYGFKLCNVPRLLCATPEYIAQNGSPKHPHDLTSYNGLLYQLFDRVHDVWRFTGDGEKYKVRMTSNRVANDGDLVRRWCLSGKGLAVKSCLDMSTDLLSGKLISIMTDFTPTPTELWLICPSRQLITPAVRLLRDMLKKKCSVILEQLSKEGIIESSALE